MTPLPFVWPWWLLFWGVVVWAFTPEFGIVRKAQKAAALPGSKDKGSIKVIMFGGMAASLVAFPLAWVSWLRWPTPWQPALVVTGIVLLIAGSLLRRHCFRQLGSSFTGDVRAEAGQKIVTSGAYRWLRHPAYTAGIIMNLGIGVALGNWASLTLLVLATFAVYVYRINVEEHALVTALGAPYQEFMRARKRLIPFVY